MFPFVYSAPIRLPFSVDLRDQIVEILLTQCRLNLRKEKALDISLAEQQITFTGDLPPKFRPDKLRVRAQLRKEQDLM